MIEKQINFLINSINDTQGIIKAIDTKIGILIAILSFPLTNIGKIYFCINSLLHNSQQWEYSFYLFIIVTFFCFWFLAFYSAIKGVAAIGNPVENILINDPSPKGSFYSGDLFTHKIKDIFYNCRSAKSKRSIDDQLAFIPNSDESLIRELIFEQMKLVFIRDKKILRLSASFNIALIWLTEGFVIYLLFKIS